METDDEIIHEIITAFEDFAFPDIEFNVDKRPIAAFILSSCLIDQLATFIYHAPEKRNNERYKSFIKEYLPEYISLNLYDNLRCKLVHNYTLGKHIRITSENAPFEKLNFESDTKVITARIMFDKLKTVFEKIKFELLTNNSETRINALRQYSYGDSKIISKQTHKFTSYTNEDANKLIEYFTPILCKAYKIKNENFTIVSLTKMNAQSGRYIVLVNSIHGKRGKTKKETQIDTIIEQFQLEPASSILSRI